MRLMALYAGAETAVSTVEGITGWFKLKLVGLHQGSVLHSTMLITVMAVISREIRGGLPWELGLLCCYLCRKVKMNCGRSY